MADPIDIHACVPGDEQALALLGQATFLETFAGILAGGDILAHCLVQHAPDIYRQWLVDEHYRLWIANVRQAPVGYLALTPPALPIADPRDDDLEVKRIYLLHRFHGAGIGRRLMDAAIAHARQRGCRRLLLGVYAGNRDAIAFYERMGYRHVGERRFRVGGNEYDDVVLALDLQGAA
ncbi:GNAT family N-acetyltransferase [Lysobacter sp. CFH 32150]|uniref:GNAT family N-acetyltransferase n=1 Tax=Lysobacter sp. CFH 32150 TaxID=2927128 RepID=UPI001FA6FEC7|nr:GNAT family N-acetyltransferase [Lysobacter sp. CFH 32150]